MLVSQSLISKTETTAVIKWQSDTVADYLWYSTDNGSTWTGINIADGKSGSYTIPRLTPNTTYKVITRLRDLNTQETQDSASLSFSTYQFPYPVTMPNFTIGEVLTVGLFNPLGRTVTVSLLGADGSTIGMLTTSDSVATGFNTSNDVNAMFNSLPSSKNGVYRVKVAYSGSVIVRTGGGYSVGNEAPTIGSASYRDVNLISVAQTGDNQKIVQSQSIVEFNVTDIAPGRGATVVRCTVEINGTEYDLTLNGTSATGGNVRINSASDIDVAITVTDTRGCIRTLPLTVSMLEWFAPTAIINVQRQSNYYSATDITVNADYAYLTGHNAADIRCKYKKTTESTYGTEIAITNGVAETVTLDNQYEWNIQITVNDYFDTNIYNVICPVGMPIVFFDTVKQSTGFNCFPKNSKSVEISGEDVFKALFYDVGDTYSVIRVPLAGLITSGTKSAYFGIQTPKSMKYISTVTVTACTGGIRTVQGGYLNGSSDSTDWTSDSTITITADKQTDNLIRLHLACSSAYTNTPNNAPVALYATNVSVSFS